MPSWWWLWSQNARFYTVLLLFFTLGLFFFHYFIEEDRPLYLLLSVTSLGLALNERMVAAFLVPILLGYVIFVRILRFERPAGLRLAKLAVYFGLCLAVGLVILWMQPTVRDPDRAAKAFGFVNNNPLWIAAGVTFYVGIPLLCAAAAGAAYLLMQKRRVGLWLILAAIVPPLAIMLISLFQYAANRYVFVSLTSMVVLAAVALKELWWQTPKNLKFLAAGFVLILFLAPMGDNFLYYRYQHGNRDNWKDAFALISTLKEDGDPVVTTHRELADYYLKERTVHMPGVDDVAQYVTDKRRVWFVVDLTAPDKAPRVYQWILANTQLVANLDVTVSARTYPMRIYLYDSGHPPANPPSLPGSLPREQP